nr:reverse transcriptase domain-containing protein [Tanacetum cinerariifolium]
MLETSMEVFMDNFSVFGDSFDSCRKLVILSLLKQNEKERLILVLKNHKEAFAWKTSDISGISPSFCKHKINFKDDVKPVIQRQLRLNPNMKKVIKKEIIKLLNDGIIYAIKDSPWVNLVHCVPKKGGMTVVTNEDNELVPTRTVTGWRVCIDYHLRRIMLRTMKQCVYRKALILITIRMHLSALGLQKNLKAISAKFFSSGITLYQQWELVFISSGKLLWRIKCLSGEDAFNHLAVLDYWQSCISSDIGRWSFESNSPPEAYNLSFLSPDPFSEASILLEHASDSGCESTVGSNLLSLNGSTSRINLVPYLHSAIFFSSASLYLSRGNLSSLAVGKSSGSGNSSLAMGMP